jgi:hypothetical protein
VKATPTGPGLWPDPKKGPFRYILHWAVIDGRQELAGITLTSMRSENSWENPEGWNAVPTLEENDDGTLKPTTKPFTYTGPVRLTSDTLRKLTDGRERSLHSIVEDTKKDLVSFVEWAVTRDPERVAEMEERVKVLKAGERKRRGAPAKWGPEHYRNVADIYSYAWDNNLKPTRAVAQHWGVSQSSAANWVAKARELGFLDQTSRGKPGGIRTYPEGEEE